MPEPYLEDPDDEFDYAADWRELLDPAAEDNVTSAAQECTLVGAVPFNKIRSAARYFLGFSYCDAAAPYRLYREPPAFHPRWGNLYAHGVSFRGWNPQANADNDNGEPYTRSPFDPAGILRTGKFEYAVCTVRYRSFGRTRFLRDDDIRDHLDEYKRYTAFTTSPRIEALSSDGASQLKWAETPTLPALPTVPPNAPSVGGAFPAPVATLLSKCAFVMSWMQVPHEYLSEDPDILIPKRLLNVMGKTNSDAFLGFDIGTLLAEPPVFEPMLFPVATDDYYPLTGWNVHVGFNFYSPDLDEDGDRISVPGSTYKGHNLMPFRNGGFYLATRDGATTGKKLLPEAPFWDIFKHVSDA